MLIREREKESGAVQFDGGIARDVMQVMVDFES